MKTTTYIINTLLSIIALYTFFSVYKHKFSHEHTDYPQYAWLALLIAAIACFVWGIIKEVIKNKNLKLSKQSKLI